MSLNFNFDGIKSVISGVQNHADDWASAKEHFTNSQSAGDGFDEHLADFSDFMTTAHSTTHQSLLDHASNLQDSHTKFFAAEMDNSENIQKTEEEIMRQE